ncbi:hypothetical protein H6F63_17170 [Trichocoleus sp. FACHB-40]|nr:hypothetical protein [Trichocoleus sp. FACHB-40]
MIVQILRVYDCGSGGVWKPQSQQHGQIKRSRTTRTFRVRCIVERAMSEDNGYALIRKIDR